MDYKFAVLISIVLLGFALNLLAMWHLERQAEERYKKAISNREEKVSFVPENTDNRNQLTEVEKEIRRKAMLERQKRERNYKNFFSYDGTPQANKSKQGDLDE